MSDPTEQAPWVAENQALRAENRRQAAEIARQAAEIARLTARLAELERRVGKDSQNSHQPPSSDGLGRRPRPTRKPSGGRKGGPIGHAGHTLDLVATPDAVERHHPAQCGHCGEDLTQTVGAPLERRQVFDLPPLRLQVTEHQVERVLCPQCAHQTDGVFPTEVTGRTQYGPGVRALAVYLRMQHLIPVERTAEVLEAITRHPIAEASIVSWEAAASAAAEPALAEVRQALQHAGVLHADETGVRIGTSWYWLHVHCTPWLTLLGWHRKRGHDGSASLGVLSAFHGTLVHDRWSSYWWFDCRHALCHAHLQRDLQAVYETTQATWATELQQLFLDMQQATEAWQDVGALPADEAAAWEAAFWRLVAEGEAAHPVVTGGKQSEATNLLKALRDHSHEVLAFLYDLAIPFTNNQAEQGLRMVKVQQKIAGCWRTEAGATIFCQLRSVIACVRKQGRDVLDALTALITGRPLTLLPLCG